MAGAFPSHDLEKQNQPEFSPQQAHSGITETVTAGVRGVIVLPIPGAVV